MGLMDYHARFYSPTLGRFTQPDSVIPDLTNSQAWNRYSYVNNSPIMYVDPSGHKPICIDGEQCFETENGTPNLSYTTTRQEVEIWLNSALGLDCHDPMAEVKSNIKSFQSQIIQRIRAVDNYFDSFSLIDLDFDEYTAYDPGDEFFETHPAWQALKFLLVGKETSEDIIQGLATVVSNETSSMKTERPTRQFEMEYYSTQSALQTPTATSTSPTNTIEPSQTLPNYFFWTQTPTNTLQKTPTPYWGATPTTKP